MLNLVFLVWSSVALSVCCNYLDSKILILKYRNDIFNVIWTQENIQRRKRDDQGHFEQLRAWEAGDATQAKHLNSGVWRDPVKRRMFSSRMKKGTIATSRYRVGHVADKQSWRMWIVTIDYKDNLEFDFYFHMWKRNTLFSFNEYRNYGI